MSKNGTDLRRQILKRALHLFNKQGIEYVGIRELAKELGIKGGNITYYFPTKDDLVLAIAQEYSKLNRHTKEFPDKLSLEMYMDLRLQGFKNQVKFRCIFLSYANLMQQNKKLTAYYTGKVAPGCSEAVRNYFLRMVDAGYMKDLDANSVQLLDQQIALVMRFWLSDAVVTLPGASDRQKIAYYMRLIVAALQPYCTTKGLKELNNWSEKTVLTIVQ